jgi:hypothetical protein
MKVPGLPAVALALSSLLVIAWSIGAASCSGGPTISVFGCASPGGQFLGTEDTEGLTCPCTAACCIDGPPNGKPYPQPGVGVQGSCSPADGGAEGGIICGPGTVLMGNECVPASDGGSDDGDPGDAAEDGPLPAACSGACWPPPPHDWTNPLLLWQGAEGDAGECPPTANSPYYNGSEGSTFALGCTGYPSGTCTVPGDVCAPGALTGWSQCVIRDGVVPCPSVGGDSEDEYTVQYIFNETPLVASTFCCLSGPLPAAPSEQ